METKKLGNYTLDIIDIIEFKSYYYDHLLDLSGNAMNSYLKAVDIPPKFFKEQPDETQDELIENRDTFVRENSKYLNKSIVIVKDENGTALNAARVDSKVAREYYEKLKYIDEMTNKYEHRSFIKDGYITYIVSSNELRDDIQNKVLVVDFPIALNKKVVIHKAFLILPKKEALVQVDHLQYIENIDINLVALKKSDAVDYTNLKSALDEYVPFITDNVEVQEAQDILREPEVVTLALAADEYIPKNYITKISEYITENVKGTLDTYQLENLVLDFDDNFKSYKQVLNLRSIDGHKVIETLNSDSFKELKDELEFIDD